MISRRKFIRSSALASAGLLSGLSLGSLTGCSSSNNCIYPVQKSKYILADIHNHLVLNDWILRTPMAVQSPALEYLTRKLFDRTDTNLRTAHKAGIDLML